jgi:DNA-binding transcriptional ArsR family regulator
MTKATEELDDLLRALGNPARREILQLVWRERRSAGELAQSLGLANASVSEHLKVLRKAGYVDVDRDGTWWYYRAEHGRLERLLQLLEQHFPLSTRK